MVYTPPPKKNATNSSSKKKTPVHQHTGCSVNPMSTKKSPLQMNKQNHPAEFEHTKDIFYIYIKVLWGLFTKAGNHKPSIETFVPLKTLSLLSTKFHHSFPLTSFKKLRRLISAICTFCQCVAGGAYTFMNVQQSYEQKESGKHSWAEEQKFYNSPQSLILIQRNSTAPRKAIQFGSKQQLPKTIYGGHQSCVGAMTNTEKQEAIIKSGKNSLPVKNGSSTIFPKVPNGFLLEFYNSNWFNQQLTAQRHNLANIDLVSLLPNPLDSLHFKDPLEKLSKTQFVENQWDEATKNTTLTLWSSKKKIFHSKMMKEMMGKAAIYSTLMGKRRRMGRKMKMKIQSQLLVGVALEMLMKIMRSLTIMITKTCALKILGRAIIQGDLPITSGMCGNKQRVVNLWCSLV
ncbi:hypothetical protein VP01_869g5 [Puccinia sorghi]|uniref:Uncharacterized protein n=1 Tax=Puccinia sorghi TaxID=27349 RepID=A0A0L6U8P5_9BASI|nr:hypothetical protein VP01_869g5 [Puccinia sorghi]